MTTSPDLTLVGVDLPAKDALVLAEESLDYLTTIAPGFAPRDGAQEVLLIEALATLAAAVQTESQLIPSRVVEAIIGIYALDRSIGTAASGVVTVSLDAPRSLTVPAGTQFGDSATGVIVETTTDVAIASGASLTLACHALVPGTVAHALTAGTLLDILDSIPGSVSASVTTAFAGGTDTETDQQYFARAQTMFRRITSSLVLPDHFAAYCLQDPRVYRATAIDNYLPGGIAGSDTGHVTVMAYGREGALSAAILEELRAAMHAMAASMVTIHTQTPMIITQPIAITVKAMAGQDATAVQAAVTKALSDWLNPGRWPWGRDIMPAEIIEIAGTVASVDYIVSVDTPSAVVAVAADQLANAGTITVTVT